MLKQRLIYFYLFLCISGIIAQGRDRNNNYDRERDDEDELPSKTNNQRQQQQQPAAPQSPTRTNTSPSTQLSAAKECEADVKKYCAKGSQQALSNLKVLQCVDELDNAANLFTPECQNIIYQFKYKMTHDARFDDAAQRQCSKDLKILEQCADHTDERGTGRLVTCLYEHLSNITDPSCRYFVNQLQAVVFNDWRLTEYFVDACTPDIKKFECGRLDDNNQKLSHEQGAVVSCLSQHYRELASVCQKEIFRLAEMQSDDYHLDRALYYACRDDRERLCSQVSSGNGRVYRCLYEQKFNTMMSTPCRKEVQRRQQLVVADVKTDIPLVRACNAEMKEHKCSIDIESSDKRSSLVRLLLCLEENLKKGQHIQDDCRREMLVHRRMLMSDYTLSPELVSECKNEMIRFCPSLFQQGSSSTIDQRGGRMIHCLLSAARKESSFTTNCLSVVQSLVRAVDPGNDIRADPLLERSCRTAIDNLCPRIKPGDSNIIMCLLDNLKSSQMTDECEDHLMEIAYFMARDWRLTPKLMRTCRNDLETYCQLPTTWTMKDDLSDNQVGIYIGCLYQRRNQINTECRSEIQRLMRIRSQSVGLMPEIETNCMTYLATCVKTDAKGEEMKCLQKQYDTLDEKCKAAVRNYTQLAMTDPSLDYLLMKACEPMIQTFCPSIDNGKENDLIRCLIRHKNEQNMDFRCKAGIEHHQIISMKDEAFLSKSFRQQCAIEVNDHCLGKKTKSSVIQCLADLMLKDVLKKQNSLTAGCRDELRFELLQRSESIDFDPGLARACRKDIEEYCKELTPGNAQILDCLKEHHDKVSAQCYAKLRKREKLDIIVPENDYSLMSKCSFVIQKFCSNENKQNILSCLRRNANQDAMPRTCRQVLYNRLMVLNSDARFNKGLIESCGTDISRFCKNEIIDNDDDDDNDDDGKDNDDDNDLRQNGDDLRDREMGGRIIQCLRLKYTETHATLTAQCTSELVEIIRSSKLDIKLDIRLHRSCEKYLDSQCTGMEQEDCLKLQYQKGLINDIECVNQVKRIILEGKADIHVDRALAFACQADLLKYCNDIPIGSGKQLECLISMQKSVTQQCRKILDKRQELWQTISKVDDISEVVETIRKSEHSGYLFSILLLISCVLFIAGCVCRPYLRYNRVRKYK